MNGGYVTRNSIWSERWRSISTDGLLKVNPSDQAQTGSNQITLFNKAQYSAVNLTYRPGVWFAIGAAFFWGQHQ